MDYGASADVSRAEESMVVEHVAEFTGESGERWFGEGFSPNIISLGRREE